MDDLTIGSIASSVVGGVILLGLGKWRGWWWKSKSRSSMDLANRVMMVLDGEVERINGDMVISSKQLGDSLASFYKNNTQYNESSETESLALVDQLLSIIKPLSTELSTANPELDDLKRAVIDYQQGLERQAQIVRHLCHPPNPTAMDPGHVRDQLLSKIELPYELLKAAKGESTIFLRGYGISWRAKRKHRQQIVTKHRALCREAIAQEYRQILQQVSLHKARK